MPNVDGPMRIANHAVVFGSYMTGNYVPRLSGQRVFVGEDKLTAHYEERMAQVRQFFGDQETDPDREQLLERIKNSGLAGRPLSLWQRMARAAGVMRPWYILLTLPRELLRRRPDIRRAEAQLHAATARIGVATADLFPKFNLTGSFGVSSSDLTKLGNLANSKFWSFGPSVTWPVFAGGRLWWNVKVQDALAEQALLAYQKTVLTALQEVETSLVAYAKEQERRQALADAVASNRQAVDLAMKLYVAGKTDFLNVTTAQRNLFVNEDLLVQSIRAVDTNLIALYKALGGGWENTPALTSTKPPANILLPVKNNTP